MRFRKQPKPQQQSRVIPGVDRSPEQALQMATAYLETYGKDIATTATFNDATGITVHIDATPEGIVGFHFNTVDEDACLAIIEMFGFEPFFGLTEFSGTHASWAKDSLLDESVLVEAAAVTGSLA